MAKRQWFVPVCVKDPQFVAVLRCITVFIFFLRSQPSHALPMGKSEVETAVSEPQLIRQPDFQRRPIETLHRDFHVIQKGVRVSFDDRQVPRAFLHPVAGNEVLQHQTADTRLPLADEIIGNGTHRLVIPVAVMAKRQRIFAARNGVGKAQIARPFFASITTAIQGKRKLQLVIRMKETIDACRQRPLLLACFCKACIVHR